MEPIPPGILNERRSILTILAFLLYCSVRESLAKCCSALSCRYQVCISGRSAYVPRPLSIYTELQYYENVFTGQKLRLTQLEVLLLGSLWLRITKPGKSLVKLIHSREMFPTGLCFLYIWCQMEMGCFALLSIECQHSTTDAANLCIDYFLLHKLTTDLWAMLDGPRDEYWAAWELNGLSEVIFRRLPSLFHSHTLYPNNEVASRHYMLRKKHCFLGSKK